jgi:hypothetical protein
MEIAVRQSTSSKIGLLLFLTPYTAYRKPSSVISNSQPQSTKSISYGSLNSG